MTNSKFEQTKKELLDIDKKLDELHRTKAKREIIKVIVWLVLIIIVIFILLGRV